MIKSICESLKGDRLSLARYLSSVYQVPETEFFVDESIVQKLKTVGTILVAAIPIVISIIRAIQGDYIQWEMQIVDGKMTSTVKNLVCPFYN
jgi:hypothetical protein